jgi:hypothetical protein
MIGSHHRLAGRIDRLRNLNGFDVRSFRNPPAAGRRGPPSVRYGIVGRYHWDGGYQDYLRPRVMLAKAVDTVHAVD